jgi:hypothetical protein
MEGEMDEFEEELEAAIKRAVKRGADLVEIRLALVEASDALDQADDEEPDESDV